MRWMNKRATSWMPAGNFAGPQCPAHTAITFVLCLYADSLAYNSLDLIRFSEYP